MRRSGGRDRSGGGGGAIKIGKRTEAEAQLRALNESLRPKISATGGAGRVAEIGEAAPEAGEFRIRPDVLQRPVSDIAQTVMGWRKD